MYKDAAINILCIWTAKNSRVTTEASSSDKHGARGRVKSSPTRRQLVLSYAHDRETIEPALDILCSWTAENSKLLKPKTNEVSERKK